MAFRVACTIVARNYLPYARVLAQTLRAAHPDILIAVLIIDGDAEPSDAALFHSLSFANLVSDAGERQRLAFMYDVKELSTALKPLLLTHLLREGAEAVVYFDPDIQIFASVGDLWELARKEGIVLTPHLLEPIPEDGLGINDLYVLQAGTYNLGFIGLGPDTQDFLDWWSGRLRRHCVSAPEVGLFVDQRWIDFVPSLFPRHAVLRDPGCNVAYWNLHERDVSLAEGGFKVNGRPLRFFHFSGLDAHTPHLLSKHQGVNPRILLSERAVVRDLCEAYICRLRSCGLQPVPMTYKYSALSDGTPIDLCMRRLYRQAMIDAEGSGGSLPPVPFEEDIVSWLNEGSADAPRVSRYLWTFYQSRPDVRAAFTSLHGKGADAYLEWARLDPGAQRAIPAPLRPQPSHHSSVQVRRGGFNITGYFRSVSGTGEAARLLALAARHGGVPTVALLNPGGETRQEERFLLETGNPYDVTVVCANADELPRAIDALPRAAQEGYRIGFWFWETEELPLEYRGAADLVDEIWTASEYVAAAVGRLVSKPVFVCPLALPEPRPTTLSREALGLPEGYVFLSLVDFLSVVQRKNPIGLIQAFRRAFDPGEGPTLLIKTINGHMRRAALESVREAARGRPDITVADRFTSSDERDGLMAGCDCYVSLHRSEGFGLTLAEAMARSKPTIATAYSGNMTFMTPENSFLVPSRPAFVPAGCEPYPQGHAWAEPDIEAAATIMRTVYEHPNLGEERGRRAAIEIRERLSLARCVAFLRERLEEIERSRKPAAPAPAPWSSAEMDAIEAEQLLSSGITYRTPSRFGWPGRLVRTALLRLLRPYVNFSARIHHHHLRVTRQLLDQARSLEVDQDTPSRSPSLPREQSRS
jgi:glycosyltransferase involved in cell wall biosynthesis